MNLQLIQRGKVNRHPACILPCMNPRLRRTGLFKRSGVWLVGIGVLLFCLALPVYATLGEDVSTVRDDQAEMKATLRISPAQGFTVHEMRLPTGTVVRQFVSPLGTVFGVSWQGPSLPNFRQILGVHFHELSRAAENRRARGPLVIDEPGFVFVSGGHMRSFFGRAYVPDKLPTGVSADAIR